MATTLFIVGAGASVDAGFPTGEQLKERLTRRLDFREKAPYDEVIRFAISNLATAQPDRNAALQAYHGAARKIVSGLSLHFSIDNYIHAHQADPLVAECGKMAIAREILHCERNSYLNVHEHEHLSSKYQTSWYHHLVKRIVEQCPLAELKTRLASLAFIVFNYDRCLEHALAKGLAQAYSIDFAEACGYVSEIRIYHPYGTVGSLPWKPAEHLAKFGEESSQGSLVDLVKQLKTFTEGMDPATGEIEAIRNLVGTSPRIVFLGFGFLELNMDLLFERAPATMPKYVIGTALGASADDKLQLTQRLRDWSGLSGSDVIFAENTCADLFWGFSKRLSLA